MANRVSKACLVVLAALAAGLVLVVPSAVWAQAAPKVVEVAITGNQNINTDTIQNVITLKAGDEYAEQATEKDRAAIMSLGYFIAVTVHNEEVPGGVKITYEVTENPKITSISVVGSEPVPAAKIIELMKTKAGQVLNTTTLNQDIEAIQSYYGEEGYIAYVTADVGPDPKTGVLTVPILVHRVESVEITGNKKTKSYVFLREMKTQPGVVFNVKILKDDIIKIYNLDILEDVKQYQVTAGSEMGQVRVSIPVVEKKTGQVSLGLGYSSRQKLVGQARLSETNFRGRAQGLNLLWEQGTSEAVGGSSSYELGFYEPWIDKRHTSLSVNAFNKILYRFSSGIFGSQTIDNQSYNERHKGGDVTLSRPLNDRTRIFLGGRFENVDTDPSLLPAGDLYKIAQVGNVGGGSIRLVHNTKDIELDPASGGYEGINLEMGGVNASTFSPDPVVPPAAQTFTQNPFTGSFRKLSADLRHYFPLRGGGPKTQISDKRTVLAMRLRVGFGSGSLPYFEQFFVGGAESIRGYREDRFWGDNMLVASVELRHPIAQSIAGVVFMDYGDAWAGNPQFFIGELPQTTSFQGYIGYGVGMRVNTPIGHLRLDYGIGSEGGRTHFSMGQAF